MSIANSFVTAGVTALFGALVLVFGQIVQRFLLEPMQEQRKTIGEIAFNLVFLANVSQANLPNDGGLRLVSASDPQDACMTLRRLGSQLRASLWTVPCYDRFASCGLIPDREGVMTASAALVGWSNSIFSGGDRDIHRDAIAKALNIPYKT